MRKIFTSMLFAFILLSGGLLVVGNDSAGGFPEVDEQMDAVPFSTSVITIQNDTDLESQASANGWAGSGKESDPYRIQQLSIDAEGGQYGIFVNGTRYHLQLWNITITDTSQSASSPGRAIWLKNVENVTLYDIRASSHHYGIYTNNSKNIEILSSWLNHSKSSAVFISNSSQINVLSSTFSDNRIGLEFISTKSIEIRSCVFSRNDVGIDFYSSSDIDVITSSFNWSMIGIRMNECGEHLINECTFERNSEHGLNLILSTDGYVIRSSFIQNYIGAEYLRSDGNHISDNYFEKNNKIGLIINDSRSCTVENNGFSLNRMGGILIYRSYYLDLYSNAFSYDGIDIDIANLFDTVNIPASNTINGDPIYMYNDGDQYDAKVPEDAGQVILAGVARLNLENLRLSDQYKSIISLFSQQILVKNSTMTDCDYGVYMTSSSGIGISESRFFNCGYGIHANDPYQLSNGYLSLKTNLFRRIRNVSIYIDEVDSCSIEDNHFEMEVGCGITLHRCGDFTVDRNTFKEVGIGLILNNSFGGSIDDNTFFEGGYGVILTSPCSENMITDNLFLRNDYNAVLIDRFCAANNYVIENAFLENGVSTTSPQVFDPIGILWSVDKRGNYWDNHTSPDIDQDGIVDFPLYLEGGIAVDEYPLSINPVEIITEPINLKAVGASTRVELSWDPPEFTRDEPVREYVIYIGIGTDDVKEYYSTSGWSNSFSVHNLQEDTHYYFSLRAVNLYGISGHSEMANAWTDGTPPRIEILQPNPGVHVPSGDVTVRWEISDHISGVGASELYMNEELVADVTGLGFYHFTDLADGKYRVNIEAEDNVGNRNDSTVEFTVDTGLPTVEITGDPVFITSDPNVRVIWSGSDEVGVYRYEYRLNNGTWNNVKLETEHYFEGMVDGYFWFDVRAVDRAGNTAYDSLEIFVDTTPPEISLTFPVSGSYVDNPSLVVKWESADALSGIDHFLLKVDGGEPRMINYADRQFTLTGIDEGSHEITLTSVDRAGNRLSDHSAFILDTILPEVLMYSPSFVDPEDVEIRVTFSEEMVEDSVRIEVSGLSGTIRIRDDAYYFEFSEKPRYNWTYYVSVSGEDLAGNRMIPFNWTITTVDLAWVNGRVVDQYDDPVVDADVYVNGRVMDSTSNLGNFNISLRSGRFEILILKSGYVNWSGEVDLIPGERSDLGVIVMDIIPTDGNGDGPETSGNGDEPFPAWIIFAFIVLIIFITAVVLFIFLTVRKKEKPIEKIDESPWDRADRMRRLAQYHGVDIDGIDKIYRNAEFNKGLGKINHAMDEIKEYNHSLADTLQEFGINPETSVEEIEDAFDSAKEREFEMLMDESLDVPKIDEFNVVAETSPPEDKPPEPPIEEGVPDPSAEVEEPETSMTVDDESAAGGNHGMTPDIDHVPDQLEQV